jgi:hypothetical protein
MTITLERPVSSGPMTEERPIVAGALSREAVGKLIGEHGVSENTVSNYLALSAPGGRYERNPFPAPDGKFGGALWWDPARKDEILAWDAARLGRGAGGGQPSHERNR